MGAVNSGPGLEAAQRGGRAWAAPIEASAAVLELTASEASDLLDFTAHVLGNSTMSFALGALAADVGVPADRLGREFGRACRDLDRLEKHRGMWRDPAKILDFPNLLALRYVCHLRMHRVPELARRRRLETIQRRLETAWELARTRAFIVDFIGPLPGPPREARDADR